MDLEDTIEEVASSPKKITGDNGSVEEHSIDDLIKADRYLASKRAKAAGGIGVRFLKIKGPGAIE